MFVGLLGYYSLIFCFSFTILIFFLSFNELKKKSININLKIYSFSWLQLITIVLSFFCLILSFVNSDFSLLSVYENSHTTKPLLYKISGTWGNHEGSLLLWIIVLIIFSFLFLLTSTGKKTNYRLFTLFFQNLIILGFVSFTLITSNPFQNLFPIPSEGLGLNPILQDPALAFHPPILYIGYVGSSIIFSSALAAMITKSVNKEWAHSIKSWAIFSWIFLTLGIFLGSIWAYYELGWGGFWFWDPVENVSLIPWLALTALFHSVIVLEKRELFHSWTILLAIITFTLSMNGTFLVRSGILNSVHTFANDPLRGIYILSFLFFISLMALTIFFIHQPKNIKNNMFHFFSKETGILINNWFMVFFLTVVLIGTIYPIFLEVLSQTKISIGPPFYNIILIPFLIPFLIFMTIGPKLKWIKTNVLNILKEIINLSIFTLSVTILIFYLSMDFNITYLIIVFFSLLLIFSLIVDLWFIFTKNKTLNVRNLGRLFAHMGFGFLILGIGLNAQYSVQKTKNLKIGESLILNEFKVTFKSLENKSEKNYESITGQFILEIKNKKKEILKPEIRIYNQPKTITSEASINSGIFSDSYITMSYIFDQNYYNVRFLHRPFMMWIWFSVLIITFGGFLSILYDGRKNNET